MTVHPSDTRRPAAFRHPAGAALLAAVLALALPGQAEDAAPPGVADPTVAWGLAGMGTSLPFLDIARLMRPFRGVDADGKDSLSAEDLAAAGHIGPDGYPLRLPRGVAALRTEWNWPRGPGAAARAGRYILTYEGTGRIEPRGGAALRTAWNWPRGPGAEARAGLYILTYEGTGRIELRGGARIEAEAPGRIVFRERRGRGFRLDITATDPGDHGDPIRAISIVRAEHAALAEAGAVFDPGWLELVRDARELRFMTWMRANDADQATWADRPGLGDASWMAKGAPVEIMVRLANEAGADPWFTLPHATDDDYVRQFATYVRDHLDPRLKAHVEYSNETWNDSFGQFDWLRARAVADWGAEAGKGPALIDYHARRATEVALIWEAVFGLEAGARLVNVLGTQMLDPGRSERLLAPATWAERDPEGYMAPAAVFEELAVTSYFGDSIVSDPALRRELALRAAASSMRAYGWLFERLALDGALRDSIPAVLARLAEQKAIAERYGLRLALYEGGQRVHHAFAVRDLSEAEMAALQEVLGGFVRSPEMGALYAQLWDGWAALGQGPFMNSTEMAAPSRWGSWGLLAHPGDRSPRADFVLSRQATGGSWWGEGGGPQYLHGVVAEGTEGPDRLLGTPEEDYLLGAGGDDTIIASPGADGVNGGAGTDTYVLPGPPGDHEVAREAAGWRVTGPMGSDFLVAVERLEFDGGTVRELE